MKCPDCGNEMEELRGQKGPHCVSCFVHSMFEGRWQHIIGRPPWNRYFRETVPGKPANYSGRVGLADSTARFPDDMEGGTLYLDITRPIRCFSEGLGTDPVNSCYTTCHVPVVDEEGVELVARESVENVCALVCDCGIALEVNGIRYRMQRCGETTEG